MNEDQKQLLAALKEAIKRAIWTLKALPDPDARFQRYGGWAFDIVRAVEEAYNYSKPRVRNFSPTPQDIKRMDVAMDWLTWLRRTEGDYALKRIMGWAMGIPLWRLGQNESCSEQSVSNRIDRSMAAILGYFGSEKIEIEVHREPLKRPRGIVAEIKERPRNTDGTEVMLTKGYVHGKGFVRGHRTLRDGSEKIRRTTP